MSSWQGSEWEGSHKKEPKLELRCWEVSEKPLSLEEASSKEVEFLDYNKETIGSSQNSSLNLYLLSK